MSNLFRCAALLCVFVTLAARGLEGNSGHGRVDFSGRVTDISCSVALNGAGNAGSGSIWLAPVSLAEIHLRGAGAYMKPQPFTLSLRNCQLHHTRYGGRVAVRWVDGFVLRAVNNENAGYLANTLPDGAQNIFLALSTNDNNVLDKGNKIVPGDPQQNQVNIEAGRTVNDGMFTYYIGYVTATPASATSGPVSSWAVWELIYN